MRCPQCGKELTSDDIVVPMFDEKGNLTDFFHVRKSTFDAFLRFCEQQNTTPSEVLSEFMRKFLQAFEERKNEA